MLLLLEHPNKVQQKRKLWFLTAAKVKLVSRLAALNCIARLLSLFSLLSSFEAFLSFVSGSSHLSSLSCRILKGVSRVALFFFLEANAFIFYY